MTCLLGHTPTTDAGGNEGRFLLDMETIKEGPGLKRSREPASVIFSICRRCGAMFVQSPKPTENR